MIELLRNEIARTVVAQHAKVIIGALHQLEQAGLPHACSYHRLFEQYRSLHCFLTRLQRQNSLLEMNLSSESFASLDRRVADCYKQIDVLKLARYKNVCGHCTACRTRRKGWDQSSGMIAYIAIRTDPTHMDRTYRR